ncbi:TIGR03086 family protein [Flexivirga sp. ID2601S]|uniref:TIGR03086 family protein n=1 Tax=Flexivirga aerilata TaxID=1656889 RepID=A0A849AHG4_9MICO|nr:TIGR03086 family protein [Flexivirga aerilata]
MFDLGPAATTMSTLVAGVTDDQLDRPTPCTDWTVGDLLAHIHQFASVFTANARKEPLQPPTTLVEDWRTAIPEQLDRLAAVWREPSAWEGRASAGGVDMSAEDNAVVAIEELTVHGWDLARATGQGFHTDGGQLDQVDRFVAMFGSDGDGPFGPRAAVPADADRVQQLIAATGRDPLWQPAAQ